MHTVISTVDDLIDALGGTKKVAEWAMVAPSAVSHWRRDKEIPPAWHFRLFVLARQRRIEIDTVKLFGVSIAPPVASVAA